MRLTGDNDDQDLELSPDHQDEASQPSAAALPGDVVDLILVGNDSPEDIQDAVEGALLHQSSEVTAAPVAAAPPVVTLGERLCTSWLATSLVGDSILAKR